MLNREPSTLNQAEADPAQPGVVRKSMSLDEEEEAAEEPAEEEEPADEDAEEEPAEEEVLPTDLLSHRKSVTLWVELPLYPYGIAY